MFILYYNIVLFVPLHIYSTTEHLQLNITRYLTMRHGQYSNCWHMKWLKNAKWDISKIIWWLISLRHGLRNFTSQLAYTKGTHQNFSRNRSGVCKNGSRRRHLRYKYRALNCVYIDIYNGIARFPQDSTAFLFWHCCRFRWRKKDEEQFDWKMVEMTVNEPEL